MVDWMVLLDFKLMTDPRLLSEQHLGYRILVYLPMQD